MWRPVPEAHATVHEAINLIIPARFADRDNEIERQVEAEALERERDFVPSGDPVRDSLIKSGWRHSRQLEDLVEGIMEDARRLLRQWLRDGKIQAFYSDPLFGGEVSIAPSAWGLQTTDRAIAGGDYYPYGSTQAGGTVGLLRSDLEKLVSGSVSPASASKKKPRVGAPETTVLRVVRAMLEAPRGHWDGVSLDSMAATFGASPATVKKARERVLQELADKDADN